MLVPEIYGRRVDMKVDIGVAIRKAIPAPFDLKLYTYDEFDEYSQSPSRLQYTIKNEGVVLSA